jgi:hypothetical protein
MSFKRNMPPGPLARMTILPNSSGRQQTTLGGHGIDQHLVGGRRFLANFAGRILGILRPDGQRHIGCRQAELGHAVRLQPDAHRVILSPENGDVADTLDPLQLVGNIQAGVVGEEQRVVAPFVGLQRNHLQNVVRALLNDHAVPANLFRQARFSGF